MGDTPLLLRQLNELDLVLDYLERMNLRDITKVPATVIGMLRASGLSATRDLQPVALIPNVLDRQQLLRQLPAIRRTGET